MKSILLTLTLYTILLGACSPIIVTTPQLSYAHLNKECQNSIQHIKRHFFYYKKEKHFILNSIGLESLTENKFNAYSSSCLNELTSQELNDIFGKPSAEKNKQLYYFLSNIPHPKVNKLYCLVFTIGGDGNVEQADIGYLGDVQ